MMAMSAHMGYNLTNVANYTNNYLEELQDQGGLNPSGHPYWNIHGWGLVYYLEGDMSVDYIFRDDEQAYGSSTYNTQQIAVVSAGAQVILGHVRRSTNIIGIDDPHPFIFHTTNPDYSFMHNGSVNTNAFITKINNLDPSWLINHPLTYYPQYPHYVDSEALFSWVMLNIHLNDHNIFEGLIDAIKGMGVLNGEDRTFILTDGIDLYCYKNSTDLEVDHDLYYSHNLDYEGLPFWIVMSKFPTNLGGGVQITHMVDDELLYLSPTGQKVSIRDCNNPIDLIQHNRQLFAGWNWESFAILPAPPVNGADILDYLETHGEITEVEGKEFNALFNGYEWTPPSFPFDDKSLYKLNMTSGINPVHYPCFNTIGLLRDSSQPLLENIQGYQYYWIGYDLMPSQRIDDAFGDEWSNVRSIKAEDWSYSKQDRGGEPIIPCWSPVGKYLEFGKGYIVSFFQDVPSFKWDYRHFPPDDIPHSKEAETFTFDETADYLSIDILDNGSRDEILEIGAFQDGECIGAVGVISFPVQLQAYVNPNGGEISFEVYSGSRSLQQVSNYQIMDISTGEMQKGVISPRNTEYAIVMLGNLIDIEEPQNYVMNLNNYPNPFNPSTTISFSIHEAGRTELIIYNTKGQRVKRLVSENLTAGEHSVIWNGKDDNDKIVSSGIYFCKLTTRNSVITKRMVMLK